MSKGKELAKNTIIVAIGKFSTQLITFLLVPIYTIFLNPSEYGTVDLIVSYISLAVLVLTFQLERGVFRAVIDSRNDSAKIARIVSSATCIIMPLFVIASLIFVPLAIWLHVPYWLAIILNVIAMMGSAFFLQLARGLGKNKIFSIASVIAATTTLISALIFVAGLQIGAIGVLLATAVANISSTIYLLIALKANNYLKISKRERQTARELLKYSAPLTASSLSWWVINVSDRTIVSVVLGAAANGIYAVSSKFSLIVNGLYAVFDMSWTESASLNINSPDRDKFFSKTYSTVIKLFGMVGVLIVAAIPFVFNILVGDEFSDARLYIPAQVFGSMINVLVMFISAIYIAKKETKKVMSTSIISAIINISVNLLLIWFIGLWAAVTSTVVAWLVMVIYRSIEVQKFVKLKLDVRSVIIVLITFAITCTFYYWNNLYGNIACLLLALAVSIYLNYDLASSIQSNINRKLKRTRRPS